MKDLLSFPERSKSMGQKAGNFVERNSGAVERVMKYLEDFLEAA